MKLEQSFDVAAPFDRVWQALIDVEHVAPCLPGAAVTGRNDDGSYNGTFTMKIGPTTASYTGRLDMKDVDEQAHTATLHAQGNDKRGQGGATATIVSKVTRAGSNATRVEVSTDYHITGRLARFGRGGMIEDISERLLKEFAARLQASLGGQPGDGAAVADATRPASGEASAEVPPPTDVGADAGDSAPLPPPEAAGPPPPLPIAEEPPPSPPPPTAEEPPPSPPPPIAEEPPPPPIAEEPPPPQSAPFAGERPSPLRPVEPSEPLEATGIVGGVLLDRIKRNPVPLIGLAAVVLLLIRSRRRGARGR